jgi:hypothetical protein
MEIFIEFLKIVLPAAAVLYAMYLVVKSFLNKELQKAHLEIRNKSVETVLPNRLHAYERMVLFLERISPGNLVVRLNNGDYTSREFQQILLNEIRSEYNHNVSQQLYMSDEVWSLILHAKEDLISTINQAADSLEKDADNVDLSRKILEMTMAKEQEPVQVALKHLKDEIRQIF